jgi:hypothetical protein
MEAKRISRGDAAALQGAVDREPFQKTRQAPRAHNRRLLQQNRPEAADPGCLLSGLPSGGKADIPRVRPNRRDPTRISAGISPCISEPVFGPLYGAFLVKKFKQSGALFFDRQFLCSIRMQSESPSLLIEPGFTHAGARRSVQSWPSYQPCSMLRPRQAIP